MLVGGRGRVKIYPFWELMSKATPPPPEQKEGKEQLAVVGHFHFAPVLL